MTGRATAFLLAALFSFGCDDEPESPTAAADESGETTQTASAERETAVSLLDRVDHCDVIHRGFLLDLGTSAADSEREFAVAPFHDVTETQIGGTTFGEYRARRIGYQFWLREPAHDVRVSLRARGAAAKRAGVYLDHRRLGTVKLSSTETQVVTMRPVEEVPPGLHTVSMRFSGTPRTAEEPFAALDWLRFGVGQDEAEEPYAAPTRERLIADIVLDQVPRHSAVLRAPGTLRCPVRAVEGSHLEVDVGFWGNGKGTAQVRVLAPGQPPEMLAERNVVGGNGATWSRLSLPLTKYKGQVIAVELAATQATDVGRVAFGEPKLTVAERAPGALPKVKVAVVVVGAGLDRRMIPPWGPASELPSLGTLARRGAAFDAFRVPSTVAGAVMATLLTGRSPRRHSVEDPLARLPEEVAAIGEMVKEASGRAAMFTGVPTSFSAFGFDRGWSRYDAYSPVRDLPATEPIDQAVAWLKAELEEDAARPRLVVIHTRGGHPPWDVSREEASQLPPDEYTGSLEPRGGAIALAGFRGSRNRLSSDDWRRMQALELRALKKQDRALGALVDLLEANRENVPYMMIVTGDVATGDPPHVPFAPAPPLHEDHLIVPTLAVFPDGRFAGTRVSSLTTTADITHTVLASLGVEIPKGVQGRSLYRAAAGLEAPSGGAHTATLGSAFVTRWGPWLMRGELRKRPSLCITTIDPACAQDVLEENPIAASALWRETFAAVSSDDDRAPVGRETASFDPETMAALRVFGHGR